MNTILTRTLAHDSQVAITLAQMTAQWLASFYELAGSYDAPQLREFAPGLGHVAAVDLNPRGENNIPLEPAQVEGFKQRSASERAKSLLEERYGVRFVRVSGAMEVKPHLMFGLIALTALQLYQLIL